VSWKGLSLVSSCGIKKQALSRGFVVRNSGGWKVMLAPTMYLQLQLAVQQYHQHDQLQQQQDPIHVQGTSTGSGPGHGLSPSPSAGPGCICSSLYPHAATLAPASPTTTRKWEVQITSRNCQPLVQQLRRHLTKIVLQQQQQRSLAQTTLQQQLLQGWSHQPHDQ